jgi:ribosomal protein S18 acetylase RimI-like enzyme
MRIEVKLGNEEEIAIAHQLMIEAFKEYQLLEVPSSAINEPVDTLRTSFMNGTEKFILCYLDGRPLGSSRFVLKDQSLYFSRVSVQPSARGKGLAKSMLVWLEDYAKKEGRNKVECRVRSSLKHNVRLYDSIGYEVTNEETVTNPNGFQVKTLVMEKLI